jgi:hypothetical protein
MDLSNLFLIVPFMLTLYQEKRALTQKVEWLDRVEYGCVPMEGYKWARASFEMLSV